MAPAATINQVVCIHDATVFNYPATYSFGFASFYRTVLPIIARRSRFLTTVSKASATDLAARLSLPVSRFEVLPNGHEHVSRWDAGKSQILDALNLQRPYFLLIGNAAPHKNLGLILGLAKEIGRLGLDIVITGAPAGIYSKVNRSEGANIVWAGYVGDDDLAALLAAAKALLFPSFFEGFGLPVVEAMALGCPVISSNHPSLQEVSGDSALLADPRSAAGWLLAIRQLLSSEELRAEMIGRGRRRVQAFRWLVTAAGYLEILRRFV